MIYGKRNILYVLFFVSDVISFDKQFFSGNGGFHLGGQGEIQNSFAALVSPLRETLCTRLAGGTCKEVALVPPPA